MSFQVPPEKNQLHLKCQFPPKIPIWPKFLLYQPSQNGSTPSHHHPGGGGGAANYIATL